MKSVLVIGALILSSITANAGTNTSNKCVTDTGKDVEVTYTHNGGGSYRLNKVVIDGATYTTYSSLIVSKDGSAAVFVPEFRGGKTLQLIIQNENSYYTLAGQDRGMSCRTSSGQDDGGI